MEINNKKKKDTDLTKFSNEPTPWNFHLCPFKNSTIFFSFVQYLHSLNRTEKKAFQTMYQGVGNFYIFFQNSRWNCGQQDRV